MPRDETKEEKARREEDVIGDSPSVGILTGVDQSTVGTMRGASGLVSRARIWLQP